MSELLNHQIVVLEIQANNSLSRVKVSIKLYRNLHERKWLTLKYMYDLFYVFVGQEVAVGSICDNIEVESKTGDLWLGCHPNGLRLFQQNENDLPGSEVCM